MSYEFFEDIVVKEEYTFEESNVPFNNARLVDDTSDEPKIKCGEVFFANRGGEFIFICVLCKHRFLDLCSFGEHIRNVHPLPDIDTYSPDVLQKDLTTLKSEPPDQPEVDSEHEQHDGEEEEEETVSMDDGSWIDDTTFEDVDEIEGARNYSVFCCYSCGRILKSFRSYRAHYRSQHPEMIERDDRTAFMPIVPEEIVCPYCLKTFNDTIAFHSHIKNEHPVKIYTCPHCPKTFPSKEKRNYHVDAHEGNKPYQCPHCPKASTTPHNLRKHINIHMKRWALSNLQELGHTNTKLSQSNQEDMKFEEPTRNREQNKVNLKKRRYSCDICQRSFAKKQILDHHRLVHSDKRPYACGVCGKTFKQPQVLRAHKATHAKKPLFSCDICKRSLTTKWSLKKHLLSHTNEKKISCDICGKLFKQNKTMLAHKRKVHAPLSETKE